MLKVNHAVGEAMIVTHCVFDSEHPPGEVAVRIIEPAPGEPQMTLTEVPEALAGDPPTIVH